MLRRSVRALQSQSTWIIAFTGDYSISALDMISCFFHLLHALMCHVLAESLHATETISLLRLNRLSLYTSLA
jgi:hypothetical protein